MSLNSRPPTDVKTEDGEVRLNSSGANKNTSLTLTQGIQWPQVDHSPMSRVNHLSNLAEDRPRVKPEETMVWLISFKPDDITLHWHWHRKMRRRQHRVAKTDVL